MPVIKIFKILPDIKLCFLLNTKQLDINLLLEIVDLAGLLGYFAQQMNIKIIGFITILVNKIVSAVSKIIIILHQHFHKHMTFELFPDARAAKPICHVSVCSG